MSVPALAYRWLAAALLTASLAGPSARPDRPTPAEAPGGQSLAGQLLVATESLNDPRFVHTVVYMVHHDTTGATGLVVNRPLRDVPLSLLLQRLGLESQGVTGTIRLHYGGPVEPGRGFVLHTADYAAEGTQRLGSNVALSEQTSIFGAIAAGTGPRRSLFAIGYAGWAPGQLENEIQGGYWVTVPSDEALLFDVQSDRKWEQAMARRRLQI